MGERRPWLSKALGHLEGLPHVPGLDGESVVVGMRGWEPRHLRVLESSGAGKGNNQRRRSDLGKWNIIPSTPQQGL